MAVIINRLNAGVMTVGAGGGGSSGHPETRFTLQAGTVETYNITGTIDRQWMIDNEYWDDSEWLWLKTITQADIGNTVTSIGDQAFIGCYGLTSMTFPSSVTSIGEGAFTNCFGLTSVTIPGSVTSIGSSAFSGCEVLTSINVSDDNPTYKSEAGLLLTKDGASLIAVPGGLTGVTIPNSVTNIGDFAFEGCSGLTSVTIPNGVTSIGDGAFGGCSYLTSVTFLGKTLAQVQAMANYPWNIEDTSIINVA